MGPPPPPSTHTHHTRSPHDLAISIPPKQFKTTLDAWNGYHALPLDEEAKDATSFITEWGRYRYKRAPQGFHASGDGYTRRCDDIITAAEIDKCKKCVDDACLHNDDIEGNFWSTVKYIDVCSRAGIVFNPDKFVFGRREVDFAGFTVKWDGYAPTKKLIEAIENFPLPTNLTGIRSWFGLIQQVSYCFSRTAEMKLFRAFLARNKRFDWPPHMTPLFYKTRQKIADMVREGVKGFVMGKPTLVAGDWSETGIGFSMQQKHCKCPMEEAPLCGEKKEDDHWKLILAGSRFTKPAEANYSPIEGEALAMAHALESTRMFTLGNENLIVGTDHKPLVPIMGLKNLEDIKNPRIRNFKDKTLMFSFRVKHIPGKHLKIADATSRNPVTKHSDTESEEMETSLSRVQWRRMDNDTFRTVSLSILLHWTLEREVSISSLSVSECLVTGFLEVASAIFRCFPGMCFTLKLNIKVLSLKFLILGFLMSSRFFSPMMGTRGLWSVPTIRFSLPRVNILVDSSACAMAKASPSIGE